MSQKNSERWQVIDVCMLIKCASVPAAILYIYCKRQSAVQNNWATTTNKEWQQLVSYPWTSCSAGKSVQGMGVGRSITWQGGTHSLRDIRNDAMFVTLSSPLNFKLSAF